MQFDFTPIIDTFISTRTIGFVSIDGANPRPRGSGVLVCCKSIQGILTCGHVLAELPIDDDFGLVQFAGARGRYRQTKISGHINVQSAIKFYSPPMRYGGPDLAFIPIAAEQFNTLIAFGSAVNLDLGKQRASNPAPDGAEAFEAVAGIVGSLTPPPRVDGQYCRLDIEGLVNVGKVVASPIVDDWDQLHFKPIPGPDFSLPSNYQGMSGGGIWRVYVKKDDQNGFDVVEARLTGVAYWQDDVEQTHGIIGHGPHSLYGHLLNEIYRRWP